MNANFLLRTKNTGQLNIDRVFARLLVVFGGMFWIAAFFGGTTAANYREASYSLPELAQASTTALIPLAITIIVFVLAMYFERLTGVVLAVMAIGMLVWGGLAHWGEIGIWLTAVSVLVAPTAISGALFELAARRQERQELEVSPAV
jgi:hypothetical protein